MRVVGSKSVETLVELSRHNRSVLSQLPPLVGKRLRIVRQGSWRGLDPFLCVATGVVEELTASCVVVRRSDLGVRGAHPQYITYTFADFLTGLYTYEIVR